MAWIEETAINQATGLLKTIFDAAVKRAGKVFQIVQLQSLNPPVLKASLEMYASTMYGRSPLSRRRREMIATVVSGINRCHY